MIRLQSGQSITIGRDLTSDLPILDAGVSRHHATLTLEHDESGGESLWVEDLHSHNGTFINTERVQRGEVQSGDVLTFGRVHVTVIRRQHADGGLDPLHNLSPERMALLVRIAREFAAEPEQRLIFQKLLELAQAALQADRGAVLLWEEKRGVFHPIVGIPHDVLRDAAGLISPRTGELILRGASARILAPSSLHGEWAAEAGSEHWSECGRSFHPCAVSAVATPLSAGPQPLGILYLDRTKGPRKGHRGPFEQQDAHFLHALAWVTQPALGASSQISDMREWNHKLESIVSQRGGDALHYGEAPAVVLGPNEDIGKLLRELETSVAEVAEGSEASRMARTPELHGWIRSLESIRLRTKAVRRLCERRSARLEEVQVAHACREAVAKRRLPQRCVVEDGGDLSVLCAPDELFLAIQLAIDALLFSHTGPGLPPEVVATGTSTPDGTSIHLRLSIRPSPSEKTVTSAPHDSAPHDSAPHDLEPTNLPLRLLEKWVRERIRGDVEAGANGASIELHLPQASVSLGETVSIPAGSIPEGSIPEGSIRPTGKDG